MSKQYGLIIPNKDKGHKIAPVSATRPSIFNDDSDSDTPVTKPTGLAKSIKKQDKLNQSKAIDEDPTVYQYDEIYDQMDQVRKESKLSRKDLERKPKYISRLLAAADKRKRENERRIERQVQKEREEEGEQFKDKESFVTSAYKKKLEEMRELEEQEKREEYLESIGDVRKQGNLDGFYRHLYDQKVNYEDRLRDIKSEGVSDVKEEPDINDSTDSEKGSAKNKKSFDSHSPKRRRKSSEGLSPKRRSGSQSPKRRQSSEDESFKRRQSSDNQSDFENKIKPKKDVKSRKYRTRRESEDEDKSENENEVKKEHLPSNLDADSDFSIDSSDSEDEKMVKNEKEKTVKDAEEKSVKESKEDIDKDDKANVDAKTKESEQPEEKKMDVKPKKPKVDIWKKRTVGEKFDEALKRYFERKALREAGL